MKIYKKEELKYKNGYIVNGDDVIVVDPAVVHQANELESKLQKACHDHGLRDAEEKLRKSLDDASEFSRISEHKPNIKLSIETPHLDKAVDEAEAIMDELDSLADANKAHAMLNDYAKLLEFVHEDFVVCYDGAPLVRFDMPLIGNILELSEEDIVNAVCALFDRTPIDE